MKHLNKYNESSWDYFQEPLKNYVKKIFNKGFNSYLNSNDNFVISINFRDPDIIYLTKDDYLNKLNNLREIFNVEIEIDVGLEAIYLILIFSLSKINKDMIESLKMGLL